MGYVLILLGAILVILAWRPALAARRQTPGNRAGADDPLRRAAEDMLDRLAVLERRLAAVQASLAELAAKPAAPAPVDGAGAAENGEATAPNFSEVLAQVEREAWRQEIYAAYEAGEDVESIARRLGRGKGEIELILNLRRHG